jgi:hypothetical protein
MSYDKPSSSSHWPSSSTRISDQHKKGDSDPSANNIWSHPSQVLGNYSSLSPLTTSDLPSPAGTIDARRRSPHGDLERHASSSITNFPPLSAASSTRLTSARRPTPPTPSQTRSPVSSIQTGATYNSHTASGRSITSPRSSTISPLQFAGGTFYSHHGPGAAGGGGGLSAGPRSGAYSPSASTAGVSSPTAYKFERSPSVSSNLSSTPATQSSFSKISATQVVLLVDTITEKKGLAEWDSKADKIRKVGSISSLHPSC